MPALVSAVVTQLKSALTLTDSTIISSFDGQPPPFSGQIFYVVHPGAVSGGSDLRLEESYGVDVTITQRIPYVPFDRIDDVFYHQSTGIYAKADAVKAALHMSYTVMNAANVIIGNSVNGFEEPLKYQSISSPVVRGADWFFADGEANPPSGVSLVVSFGGASRMQSIESQA